MMNMYLILCLHELVIRGMITNESYELYELN